MYAVTKNDYTAYSYSILLIFLHSHHNSTFELKLRIHYFILMVLNCKIKFYHQYLVIFVVINSKYFIKNIRTHFLVKFQLDFKIFFLHRNYLTLL